MKTLGLYIHIPFCERKCPYCDFISFPNREEQIADYCKALIGEICLRGDDTKEYVVDTIYFGGGTPSLLSPKEMGNILGAIKNTFALSANPECTIEVNPNSFTLEKAEGYYEAGINRLSIGAQSFSDKALKVLGRLHKPKDILMAYENGIKAGFENISMDFMFGLPGQRLEDVMAELKMIGTLKTLKHVSYYGLTIMEDTPFYAAKVAVPEDAENRMMYDAIIKSLALLGCFQYEVSNFAKVSYASRHNLKYWHLEEYLGLGLGAHSYFNGERFHHETQLDRYILASKSNTFEKNIDEILDRKEMMKDYMMLGFRLNEGISRQAFKDKFGEEVMGVFGIEISMLKERHLIFEKEDSIQATKKGFDYMNEIAETFI